MRVQANINIFGIRRGSVGELPDGMNIDAYVEKGHLELVDDAPAPKPKVSKPKEPAPAPVIEPPAEPV